MQKVEWLNSLSLAGASFTSAIVLAASLTACQSQVNNPIVELVGTDRVNEEVTLTLFEPAASQVRLNNPIFLLLRNRSTAQITFPPDFGSRVYAFSEESGDWHEIENRGHYIPADKDIILNARGELPRDEAGVPFLPMVDDASSYSRVLVVVVGRLETGESVGAYLDIPLGE